MEVETKGLFCLFVCFIQGQRIMAQQTMSFFFKLLDPAGVRLWGTITIVQSIFLIQQLVEGLDLDLVQFQARLHDILFLVSAFRELV